MGSRQTKKSIFFEFTASLGRIDWKSIPGKMWIWLWLSTFFVRRVQLVRSCLYICIVHMWKTSQIWGIWNSRTLNEKTIISISNLITINPFFHARCFAAPNKNFDYFNASCSAGGLFEREIFFEKFISCTIFGRWQQVSL